MYTARMVVFHEPKLGGTQEEWEDGAGFDPGDARTARPARCVVLDGATEAYEAVRWVAQLVDCFLGTDADGGRPELTLAALDTWFGHMQERWQETGPRSFRTLFEERKFREEGSFATLLGCDIDGLDAGRPAWTAVALGDTVMFHVRGAAVLQQFPAMSAEDFGLSPDGVFTAPGARDRMRRAMVFARGRLQLGDRLYLATDALAAWMIRRAADDGARLWAFVDRVRDPVMFRDLVDDRRRRREMTNDDVTLMRVEIADSEAEPLVVGA